MQITFDTATVTEADKAIIAAALGLDGAAPAEAPAKAEEKPKAAPARRTPAKKAATPPPAETEDEDEEQAEDEAPEDADVSAEDEDDDDDLLGSKKLTVDDAIARATELVKKGQQAQVKKALGAVGAKRVSEVKASQVDAFIKALG